MGVPPSEFAGPLGVLGNRRGDDTSEDMGVSPCPRRTQILSHIRVGTFR